MNHVILFVICALTVEIFIRSDYISLINSYIKVIKKAVYTISNKKISDHWKENVIQQYAIQMMKYSLKMLLIFLSVIFVFIIVDNSFNGFLKFTLSLNGIIESLLFAFSYAYLKKQI